MTTEPQFRRHNICKNYGSCACAGKILFNTVPKCPESWPGWAAATRWPATETAADCGHGPPSRERGRAAFGGRPEEMHPLHLNYYAVSGKQPEPAVVLQRGATALKSLKRRSQRAFMSWEKFTSITDRFFPSIRIVTRCHVTVSTPEPEGRARSVSSARRESIRWRLAAPTATAACALQHSTVLDVWRIVPVLCTSRPTLQISINLDLGICRVQCRALVWD
jgi:hypothetical protein